MADIDSESGTAPSPPAAADGVRRLRAFAVHLFTALGAAIALLALLEAVREHWAAMFGWLGVALAIDALDGPLARRWEVATLLPDWSGDTLDLVVDYVTYVFVPAYAMAASGLLLPLAAPLIGAAVVVSGALYFADRRMKADDNHFRGFPALWNAAAFYLFLLKPAPWLGSLLLVALVLLTFVPFHVIHPVRVARFRVVNIVLMGVWAVLALAVLWRGFVVPVPLTLALVAIAAWVLFSDLAFRLVNRIRA
jgi:phosphatidylcholine synthase